MDETALRAVFEVVALPQVVLDRGGVVLLASRDYLRIVGLPRAAVIGRSVFALPPFADSAKARGALAAALEHALRSAVLHSFQIAAESGLGPRFSGVTLTPVPDAGGAITHLLQSFELVAPPTPTGSTDRERRLRKLLENSDETTALVDARGTFIFAFGIERVLGFSEAEWRARPALAGVHPEDVGRFGAQINEMRSKAGGRFRTRVRILHKDGSWRVIEISAVNRLDDPDIAAVVIGFRDVTTQLALQEDVARSEERLRIALTAARALCWDLDLVNDRHTYSEDYGAYYGLPPGSYHGHDSLQAVHPEDRALILNAAGAARGPAGVFSAEFRGLPRPEGTRWYASHGRVYRDEQGHAVRMVGITWDISERRQLQEQRRLLEERLQEGQKLESLGVLAGGIAHDFNNLLMVVLGNASLLEALYAQDDDARRYLQQIEEASRRASDLCHQLLAYAGKGQFRLSTVELSGMIEGTMHLLQVSISKKVALRFELSPKLPRVRADATQLRQVLMNLVINASEAIQDGSGVIAVETGVVQADRAYLDTALLASELAPGAYAYVDVSDTGSGMSEETMAHIFEPFFSTKFPGRGLGLAAVLGIVRGHHGALRVRSEVGQGSSFRLLLPALEEAAAVEPAEARAPERFRGAGTVLLVDDEEAIRMVGKRMLEDLGFRVLTAADGREAIRLFREHAGALRCVLMDVTMPQLDGHAALRALREIEPAGRVLLMSGYNESDDDASADDAREHAGFLHKPFSLKQLESALRALLG